MTIETIALHAPADLHAFITATLGYTPSNSLVVIGLEDKSLAGTLRTDLGSTLLDPATMAHMATMFTSEGTDAVLSVIYHDESFDPAETVDALETAFPRHGLKIADVLEVTGNHIRDYHQSGPGTALTDGDTLLPADTPERAVDRFLTPPLPSRAAALHLAVAEHGARLGGHRISTAEYLEDWHTAINGSADSAQWLTDNHHHELLARMVRSLYHQELRDALAGSVAIGFDSAQKGLASRDDALEVWGLALTGDTGTRPRWDLMDRFARALAVVASATRDGHTSRDSALTLMAWIEWCRGRGSHSGAFLDRVDSEYPLAHVLRRVVDQGHICKWARNPNTAWSRARL